jgi:hypothetical protein
MSIAVASKPGIPPGVRRGWSRAALASMLALVGLGGSGCIIVDDTRGHGDTVILDDSAPLYVTIDADQILHTDIGNGVGLFVEYATGGGWRLWTSCDTNVSGEVCSFQAHVIGSSPFSNVTPTFDPGDTVELVAADELWFYAQTGSESDGVDFASDPGAPVELELWLDGYIDPQYIYWVGDGVVHEGAGDSPVVFEPNTP